MCEPMMTGSTVLIADTPAVRKVLRPRCLKAAPASGEVIACALRASGYTWEAVHPGVLLVTPRSTEPDGDMFDQLWEVFTELAPHALDMGLDGRPPRIGWEYPGHRDPFEWIVRDGQAVSWDAEPDGSFDYRRPYIYQYTQQRVETWTETMEVTGEQAQRWFAAPGAPSAAEINAARAHFMNLPRDYEFVESETCMAGTVTVIED